MSSAKSRRATARGVVETRVERERREDGLEGVREPRVAVAAARALLARRHAKGGAEIEPAREIREVVLRDEDGPRLRERPLRLERKRVEEKLGDEVVQDAVAEELERLVVLGIRVVVRERRMRERADEEPPVAEGAVERPLDGVEWVAFFGIHARECKRPAALRRSRAPEVRNGWPARDR